MQLSFGDAEDLGSRKRTRREVFLAQMEQVVPWQALLGLIEPHDPKLVRPGRQPYPLAMLLRIHFLQQGYALSDPADETTILNFRRLLERHGLAEKLFKQVNAHLQRKDLSLRPETILDAPGATKNTSGTRDLQMHQTRRGQQGAVGLKAHLGVDEDTGLVQHVECTAANVADVMQAHQLLPGEEVVVYGDSGHTGSAKREQQAHRLERWKARVRTKVEHPFRVVQRQFGHIKVRYRGLAKNANRSFVALG